MSNVDQAFQEFVEATWPLWRRYVGDPAYNRLKQAFTIGFEAGVASTTSVQAMPAPSRLAICGQKVLEVLSRATQAWSTAELKIELEGVFTPMEVQNALAILVRQGRIKRVSYGRYQRLEQQRVLAKA